MRLPAWLPLAPPVPERVTVLAAADLDGDRRLTVGELARYARERVRAEAQAMNRKQEPLLQGEGADRVLRVLP